MAGRLDQVTAALVTAVTAALNSVGLAARGKVAQDWFAPADLQSLLAAGGVGISVVATAVSRKTTRWAPITYPIDPAQLAIPFTATIVGRTVTFAGSIAANVNTVVLVGYPQTAVSVTTTAQDTLPTFAQRLAAAIVAANIPGVSASANGATLTVVGSDVVVNLGATVTAQREVGRIDQRFQVTIWAANGDVRGAVEGALLDAVGTSDNPWTVLGDGGPAAWTRYASGPSRKDERVEDLMAKRADVFFDVEYALLTPVPLTQVGAFVSTLQAPVGTFVAAEG